MPRITQDPTGQVCPDFAGETYTAIQLAMTTGRQLTDVDTAERLVTAWNQTHAREVEAWDLQVQTDVAEQEELQRIAQAEEERLKAEEERQKDKEQKELKKKRPKINDFDDDKMVGDFILPRPSQFAIGKLKSFSFTELWYFTEEGCSEAQESSRTLPDDAYSITRVDDLVALKPVTAFKASKNVIPDTDLSWRQMNIGKNTMLQHMELWNWPSKHVDSFARFYLHLELDPMRSHPNGERVLLAYQAKVWHQWHDDIAWGQGFNIAQINQRLLATMVEEVWDAIRLEAVRKVSFFSNMLFSLPCWQVFPLTSPSSSSFHTLPLPLPCHPFAETPCPLPSPTLPSCQHILPCMRLCMSTANTATPNPECYANTPAMPCHCHTMPLAMPCQTATRANCQPQHDAQWTIVRCHHPVPLLQSRKGLVQAVFPQQESSRPFPLELALMITLAFWLPSRQRRRRHASSERSRRSPNPRRSQRSSNNKPRGKGGEQSFFQGGTAARGGSACAVCLGRHEHKYAKCSATKLWNGGKTCVCRNEQGRLITVDGLPICFSFQTPAGCSETTHPTRHTCSGCGKSGHGAQQCSLTQKV